MKPLGFDYNLWVIYFFMEASYNTLPRTLVIVLFQNLVELGVAHHFELHLVAASKNFFELFVQTFILEGREIPWIAL